MFNKLIDERHDEILKSSEKINYDDLIDRSLCFNCRSKSFNNFENAFSLMK